MFVWATDACVIMSILTHVCMDDRRLRDHVNTRLRSYGRQTLARSCQYSLTLVLTTDACAIMSILAYARMNDRRLRDHVNTRLRSYEQQALAITTMLTRVITSIFTYTCMSEQCCDRASEHYRNRESV